MNWIKRLVEFIVFVIDNVERLAIVAVSRVAPWAAPLAPAYLVARMVEKHFETPVIVAVAVGVTLEAVGIASTHITLEMYQYNQTRRKHDPPAPFDVGLLVTSVYFVVGIILTVVLELMPELTVLAPAAFFLLAIVAYVTLALMSGHSRRLEAIRAEREEKKAERQKRNEGGTEAELDTGAWGGTTRKRAKEILAERPDITGSELGRMLGRSAGFGRRLKRELGPELSSNGKEPVIVEAEH